MSLPIKPTGEAAQGAVFSDYAMAGDDNGYGISARGCTGGADGVGDADAFGQFRVSDGLAVRNSGDFLPD